MNKKTIYYVGPNGDKDVLFIESEKRAETLFNSGQAIEIDPMVWALDEKKRKEICKEEIEKYLSRKRGLRLSDKVEKTLFDIALDYGNFMGGALGKNVSITTGASGHGQSKLMINIPRAVVERMVNDDNIDEIKSALRAYLSI